MDSGARARREEEEREREFQRLQAQQKENSLAEETEGERKLSSDELETMAKTLQLLVKHRGGGPFGAGRLQGAEADDLVRSLTDTLNIMKRDASVAPSFAATPAPAPAPAPASTPAPLAGMRI